MLNKNLIKSQWFSLVVLVAGVAMVQLSDSKETSVVSADTKWLSPLILWFPQLNAQNLAVRSGAVKTDGIQRGPERVRAERPGRCLLREDLEGVGGGVGVDEECAAFAALSATRIRDGFHQGRYRYRQQRVLLWVSPQYYYIIDKMQEFHWCTSHAALYLAGCC